MLAQHLSRHSIVLLHPLSVRRCDVCNSAAQTCSNPSFPQLSQRYACTLEWHWHRHVLWHDSEHLVAVSHALFWLILLLVLGASLLCHHRDCSGSTLHNPVCGTQMHDAQHTTWAGGQDRSPLALVSLKALVPPPGGCSH